jgi:dTDP-4-amino-4,6-dideoxygalactose transaminase
MALGVGPGDEVITTPFTFFAAAGAVSRVGAKLVFVDIEADTFNIDPAKIPPAVTDKTKAILPVHLYGQVAEMDPNMEIAAANDILVIEDAAQSIGASYKGRKAGSIGTVGCLSFYPTKNLGACGDAGMIVTQDAELADRLANFRNHGQSRTYYHDWVGGNFRMDSVQAAILSVKLRYLGEWSAKRAANAARYNELLACCDGVVTPTVRDYNVSIYNHYIIRAERRDELRSYLSDTGVSSYVYYPLALHLQPCFESLGYTEGDFPVSEKATQEVLSLPVHSMLTDEQIEYTAAKIKEFFS